MIDTKRFYSLFQDSKTIENGEYDTLKQLVYNYPYFDGAKFLFLKVLYESDYKVYLEHLEVLSPLVGNREALFYYIFKNEFADFFVKTGKKKLSDDQTSVLLNAFFETKGLDDLDTIFEYEKSDLNNLVSNDYLAYLEQEEQEETFTETKLLLPPPIPTKKEQKKEAKSPLIFIENITTEDSLDEESTIETSENIEEGASIPSEIPTYDLGEISDSNNNIPQFKHQNIIDRFLENSKDNSFSLTLNKEEIKKDKDYSEDDNSSQKGELEEDTFFTETLARIYTKQGRYEKAYEIIKHLSLKYPRKNTYFADQLNYLEILIINSKYNKK